MHLRLGNFLVSHRVLIVGGLFALVASITVAVTQFGRVHELDAQASARAQEQMTHESAGWAERLADLASTQTALGVTIVGALVLLATRHWRGAMALALVYPVTQGAVQLVKVLIARPRPEESFADPQGFSFPSAHSATSVAVYATIAFILIRASRRGHSRIAVASFAGALVLAVGLSRVLLGAHYPTDVLAGWGFGALLASLCWLAASRMPLPRTSLSAAR
ncbi:MAG TPA: phosphatase PAP2 family protein [Thermoleophilaceae bacterium]|nr:phosphatase PAP2 family protein [Thermoleophilaceae bacterium]